MFLYVAIMKWNSGSKKQYLKYKKIYLMRPTVNIYFILDIHFKAHEQ